MEAHVDRQMSTAHVHLTRAPDDVPDDELGGGLAMWIRLYDRDGNPMLVSRAYVEQLRKAGWRGLEQIPEECLT
jgi:hypothetical protein